MSLYCIKLPRPCQLDVYESAARKIAASAARLTSVIAVYQIGNLATPGISDLDIVVVANGSAGFSPEIVLNGLSDEERYTLMHGLFCVNDEFWRNRQLFFKFDNLKLLFGQDLEPDSLPPNWLVWSTLRTAIQHVIRVYASLSVQLFLNALKVRSLLCELHALRYDLEAFSPLLAAPLSREFSEYLATVKQLRLQWFRSGEDMIRRFTALCLDGKALLKKVIAELNLLPEIQLEGSFPSESSLGSSATITTNRVIRASNGEIVELASWSAAALKYCAKGRLLADLTAMGGHRIGQFMFGIPSQLYRFVVNSTWQSLDSDRHCYMTKRSEIISFHAHPRHTRKSTPWALPVLDFAEK